jgi:hypothetical protein
VKLRVVDCKHNKALEAGLYLARVAEVQGLQTQYGPAVRFWFEVLAGEEKVRVPGIANAKLSRGSKLRAWVEALLGRQLQHGEELDAEQLVGKPCKVALGVRDGHNRVEHVYSRTVVQDEFPF